MVTGCIFCAIASGEADASVVAATDRAVAFMDIRPIGDGHTLVIPRTHATGLSQLALTTTPTSSGSASASRPPSTPPASPRASTCSWPTATLPARRCSTCTCTSWLDAPTTRSGHVDYGAPRDRSALEAVADRLRDAMT